jgi:hypothetical protein
MIRYITAEDDAALAESTRDALRDHIEYHFGPERAKGFVICGEVEDALREVQVAGSDLQLLVLDLDFRGDVYGGFRILDALTDEQKRVLVVCSAHLGNPSPRPRTQNKCWEDLIEHYAVPPDRIVDKKQGTAGLWAACVRVLGEGQWKA